MNKFELKHPELYKDLIGCGFYFFKNVSEQLRTNTLHGIIILNIDSEGELGWFFKGERYFYEIFEKLDSNQKKILTYHINLFE